MVIWAYEDPSELFPLLGLRQVPISLFGLPFESPDCLGRMHRKAVQEILDSGRKQRNRTKNSKNFDRMLSL